MSPMLQSVEAAGVQGMLRKRAPNRISAQDFYTDTERLRALFAQLVYAHSADQVSIIPAVSYGMAIVAQNLKVEKGQNIVLVGAQFPSNVYPWTTLAKEKGLNLKVVEMPVGAENRGRIWNERILEAIDERTALVAIGHIHWANGTIFDIKKIGQKAHQHGGLIVVDGTQSVGALPIDVQDMQLDALICAGYKWLMGPYASAYAWFGAAFLNGKPLEENWINRLDSENFARLVDYQPEYQAGARRFDVGQRSNFIQIPMGIMALQQLLDWTPEAIQVYCQSLLETAIPIWQKHGYSLDRPESRAAHLFGIQLPARVKPELLQEKLKAKNIFISLRGDFVRVAPNVYNDVADITALTEVLTGF